MIIPSGMICLPGSSIEEAKPRFLSFPPSSSSFCVEEDFVGDRSGERWIHFFGTAMNCEIVSSVQFACVQVIGD
jgi:hypothetical protein